MEIYEEKKDITERPKTAETIRAVQPQMKEYDDLLKIFKEVSKGTPLKLERVVLHQALDVPKGGGMITSLYASKGIAVLWSPEICLCSHKGAKFLVEHANIVGGWL